MPTHPTTADSPITVRSKSATSITAGAAHQLPRLAADVGLVEHVQEVLAEYLRGHVVEVAAPENAGRIHRGCDNNTGCPDGSGGRTSPDRCRSRPDLSALAA